MAGLDGLKDRFVTLSIGKGPGMLLLPNRSCTGLQDRSDLVGISGEALRIYLNEMTEDGHDDTGRPNSFRMALLPESRHPPAAGKRAIEPPSGYYMPRVQFGIEFVSTGRQDLLTEEQNDASRTESLPRFAGSKTSFGKEHSEATSSSIVTGPL